MFFVFFFFIFIIENLVTKCEHETCSHVQRFVRLMNSSYTQYLFIYHGYSLQLKIKPGKKGKNHNCYFSKYFCVSVSYLEDKFMAKNYKE